MDIITAKIDVTKILKEHLFTGKKGKYLDICLMPNRDGKSEFGDDYFITQGVSKEARERNERGPIIGNARVLVRKGEAPAARQAAAPPSDGDDLEVPF